MEGPDAERLASGSASSTEECGLVDNFGTPFADNPATYRTSACLNPRWEQSRD